MRNHGFTPKTQTYIDELPPKLDKNINKVVNICFKSYKIGLSTNKINQNKPPSNLFSFDHQLNKKMLLTGIRSIINIKSQNFCNICLLLQNDKTVQNLKDIAQGGGTSTSFVRGCLATGSEN